MPTLRDVATLAGVSAMTVSNVVNGRQGKVSAATVQRVQAAIRELGYVPNAQARVLAGASSRIVALVYGAGEGTAPLSVSHESVFVGACEEACRKEGLALMLCGCQPGEDDSVLARLQAWNVAGIITFGTVPPALRGRMADLGHPIVGVDLPEQDRWGEYEGRRSNVGRVGIDDFGGGRLAGEQLARLGHRKIVFVAPCPDQPGVDADRLAGLQEGLAGGRVRIVQAGIDYGLGMSVGEDLAVSMGTAGETAVFVSSDITAMGVVAGLKRAGVAVPGQISVVGFDGFAVSTYADPVLTTVVQPVADKAARAVAVLRELVQACAREAGGADGMAAVAKGRGGDSAQAHAEGAYSAAGVYAIEYVLPVTWREGGTLAAMDNR